jgi:hypothetical protein
MSRVRVGRRSSPEWAVLVATLALGVALSALAVGRHLGMLVG